VAVRRYVVTSHTKERFIEEATQQLSASQGVVGSGADVMLVKVREVPSDEVSIRRAAKQESPDSPPPEDTISIQFIIAGPHHAGGFAFHEGNPRGYNFVAVFTEGSDEVGLNIFD